MPLTLAQIITAIQTVIAQNDLGRLTGPAISEVLVDLANGLNGIAGNVTPGQVPDGTMTAAQLAPDRAPANRDLGRGPGSKLAAGSIGNPLLSPSAVADEVVSTSAAIQSSEVDFL